jgi:hypothetical protein
MAALTLAQVAYFSQELTHHLKEVNISMVKACLELEKARLTLNELLATYDQWYGEDVTRIRQ